MFDALPESDGRVKGVTYPLKIGYSGRQMRILALTSTLPIISLAVAYWGSTWGWNTDDKLQLLAPHYTLVAYVILLLPYLLLFVPRVKLFTQTLAGRVRRGGFLQLLWGLHMVSASIILIHLFESDALWLGSIGTFYIGFFATLFTVIRMLS